MKKHIALKMIQYLPEKIRLSLYRKMAQVPELAFDSNFKVEIARTQEDLEKAYRLLHDCYVGSKLMTPHPSKMRCTLYSFLPDCTVIVAKYKGSVVGTVSLIRDSYWGLPSDQDYKLENDHLRSHGNNIVEVSALAVDKNFRHAGNAVSLLLMKYLYNYVATFLEATQLICTVHPRAEDFYKALWDFRRNGKVIRYKYVEGALAIHISKEVSAKHAEKVIKSYGSDSIKFNLGLFVTTSDNRFHYPLREAGRKIDPVLTPDLFEYFCVVKTKLWENLTSIQKQGLLNVYTGLFQYKNAILESEFKLEATQRRHYRIPLAIQGLVKHGEKLTFVKVLDLSAEGAFISWSDELPATNQTVSLTFKISGQSFTMKSEVKWTKRGNSQTQGYGYGIRFLNPESLSSGVLQNWLYKDDRVVMAKQN